MNIKTLFFLIVISMSSIDLGCTQGNGDLEICGDFCIAEAQCEWGDSAQNFNTPSQYYRAQCLSECLFYLENGAFVVRRSTTCEEFDDEAGVCWKQSEQEEFVGNVGSSAVESYLGCLVDLDAWKCNGGSYEMVIESAEECSSYGACIESLGDGYLPIPQWKNGQCVSESGENDRIYLDIVI